jgi:hypothetical protein
VAHAVDQEQPGARDRGGGHRQRSSLQWAVGLRLGEVCAWIVPDLIRLLELSDLPLQLPDPRALVGAHTISARGRLRPAAPSGTAIPGCIRSSAPWPGRPRTGLRSYPGSPIPSEPPPHGSQVNSGLLYCLVP